MITKEVWDSLSTDAKQQRISEALTVLYDIDSGTHALSGKPEQGQLPLVKKEVEQQVLKFIEWEKPNYEKNRPSAQGN